MIVVYKNYIPYVHSARHVKNLGTHKINNNYYKIHDTSTISILKQLHIMKLKT